MKERTNFFSEVVEMKKIIISIIILVIVFIPNCSRAVDFSLDDIFKKGEDFITKGSETQVVDENDIYDTILPIARALVAVGSLVIALATGIMAIKYLMSGPEKKAELKGQLVGLVIATVVIFGAQAIWATMYSIFSSL